MKNTVFNKFSRRKINPNEFNSNKTNKQFENSINSGQKLWKSILSSHEHFIKHLVGNLFIHQLEHEMGTEEFPNCDNSPHTHAINN